MPLRTGLMRCNAVCAADLIKSQTAGITTPKKTDLSPSRIIQMRREWRDTEKHLRSEIIRINGDLAAFQHRERTAMETRYEFIRKMSAYPNDTEPDEDHGCSICIVKCKN